MCEPLRDEPDVLSEKAVFCLKDAVWVVVNKSKVKMCVFVQCLYRIRGASPPGVVFGHMELTMHTTRQRMANITIGVLAIVGEVDERDRRILEQWIRTSKIAILLGSFGKNNSEFVKALAVNTDAIGNGACCQEVSIRKKTYRSRGEKVEQVYAHPTYILLYGYSKQKLWHASAAVDDFALGQDIQDELIPIQEAPCWPENRHGSTSVPHLGTIKMKKADLEKWVAGSFQTCLWLGTATPSKKSQMRP